MAIALFIVVPVVALVVVLELTSGHSGTPRASKEFSPLSRTPAMSALPSSGALVADVHRGSELRAAPGGRPLTSIKPRTEFGSPQVLLVVRRVPGWLGVVSPLIGNAGIGWIPQSVTTLRQVNFELQVSLSGHRLTVLEGKSVLQRYRIAVGRPDAPTPEGRFSVTDRLLTHHDAGPYGCCILALSAKSPHAIQGWTGGNRVAIHSTPDTSAIGQSVSHGCVRVTVAQGRWLLNHIPLGTPTVIRS